MNENLSQLCTPERAEDAAGMDLTRICTVSFHSLHVSQPEGHMPQAQPVQASDAGEESRVVRCGGAICDGMTAQIQFTSWRFRTACSDCERFQR